MKKSLVLVLLFWCLPTFGQRATVPIPGPRISPMTEGVVLGEPSDTLTSPELRVRAVLPFVAPADRTIFKEISPCRLVDTRKEAGFSAPYGNLYGGDFAPGESRTYRFAGKFSDHGSAVNPCNGEIPQTGVVALTIQVWAINAGGGEGAVSFGTPFVPRTVVLGSQVFVRYGAGTTVQAGQVQILDQMSFTLTNHFVNAELAVEILGYHTSDEGAVGPTGPAGIGNMTMERKCACFVTGTATVTFSKPVYFVLSQYENMDGKLAAQPINYAGSEGRTATFNGSIGRNFCAYNFSQ